jgi:uncharacterized membrane protein
MKFTLLKIFISIIYVIFPNVITGHEGHHHQALDNSFDNSFIDSSNTVTLSSESIKELSKNNIYFNKILHWFGQFHFFAVHFPIALVMMTFLAELCFLWTKKGIYEQAARFMIIAAAVAAIPTALFGLALASQSNYTGRMETLFWWHQFFGIATVVSTIIAAFFSEEKAKRNQKFLYFVFLVLAFVATSGAGFLGGELAFGPSPFLPPLPI